MMYYIADIIGKILYIFPSILIFLCNKIGLPGTYVEQKFWDTIEWLDQQSLIYLHTHIFHWNKSIREQCYNCRRLKLDALGKVLGEFTDDIEEPIFGMLFSGIEQTFQGVMELFEGIMDLIDGIVGIL